MPIAATSSAITVSPAAATHFSVSAADSTVAGAATQAVDQAKVVDCRWAFVDFPSPYSPNGTTWGPGM